MEKFHRELNGLKKDVIKMGKYALEMLRKSIEALKTLDMDAAEEVYNMKFKLMECDAVLEDRALKLIALYQPMAKDLRLLAAILKMITYITRIGRFGKDISNIIRKELKDKQHIKKLISIPFMYEIVEKMVLKTLDAFDRGDPEPLLTLSEDDDRVDELRMSIFRECLTYMMEDPRNIPICTSYIMISRYLERCGDNACKMGEKVYYYITGERIEIK